MITLQNMFDFMYTFIDFVNGLWAFLNSNIQLPSSITDIIGNVSVFGLLFGGGFALVFVALILKALVPFN